MLFEHALAPSINRMNCRLIHALGSHGEAPGRLLAKRAFWIGRHQLCKKAVVGVDRLFLPKAFCCINQTFTYALRQLSCGRASKGHNKNFRGYTRLSKTVTGLKIGVMPKNQTYIKCCNSPGFSCSCTSLNQAASEKWKAQRLKSTAFSDCVNKGHAATPDSCVESSSSCVADASEWGSIET